MLSCNLLHLSFVNTASILFCLHFLFLEDSILPGSDHVAFQYPESCIHVQQKMFGKVTVTQFKLNFLNPIQYYRLLIIKVVNPVGLNTSLNQQRIATIHRYAFKVTILVSS